MLEPKVRPATQADRNELLERLLENFTHVLKVSIDLADIEVEDHRVPGSRMTYKVMRISWKQNNQGKRVASPKRKTFYFGEGEDNVGIISLPKMVKLYKSLEDEEEEEEDEDEQ